MTQAMLDGRLVPLAEAKVSVLDRSFLYGDGLFETLRVLHGHPFRWQQHLDRLQAGAQGLGILLPWTAAQLWSQAATLIAANAATDSMLRLHLSRGVGARGYSPRGADQPFMVMTTHSAPPQSFGSMPEFRVSVSPWRVPAGDATGRWKTANRLLNVVARKTAEEAGADEALLLNTNGHVCEASGANLFWVEKERLLTPPLDTGALAGVTRSVVSELAAESGCPVSETTCGLERLLRADSVFLTQSALGVVWVRALDARRLSGREVAANWWRWYAARLDAETRDTASA